MSRLVVPPTRAVYEANTMRGDRPNYEHADDYTSRLAKYIPGEATAGYLALENLMRKKTVAGEAATTEKSTVLGEAGTSLVMKAAAVTSAGEAAPTNSLSIIGKALLDPTGWAFVFCLIFAPVYVWALGRRSNNPDWQMQALIAAVAFCVWAYAIESKFLVAISMHPYNPEVAGMFLIFFSMLVALYEPKAR